MTIEEQVAKIFSVLFQKEINSNDSIAKGEDALWDSMKHIEIIMAVEEELDVSFAPQDIPKLTSMKLIVDKIKELQ